MLWNETSHQGPERRSGLEFMSTKPQADTPGQGQGSSKSIWLGHLEIEDKIPFKQ